MAAHAVHFGHPTSRWNPKMKPFIYGEHKGFHVFDLHKTAAYLKEALVFLEKAAAEGKTILLVGTKPQCKPLLSDIHDATGMPIMANKWIPGFLTNFRTIKKRIDYFNQLKEDDASGALEKYTKKEQMKLRKKIQELSALYSGVQDLKDRPDIVFVVDINRDQIAVKEAKRCGIPVVALVDTNSDPDPIDFIIPANDDSLKSLEYLLGLVKEALSASKSKKAK